MNSIRAKLRPQIVEASLMLPGLALLLLFQLDNELVIIYIYGSTHDLHEPYNITCCGDIFPPYINT